MFAPSIALLAGALGLGAPADPARVTGGEATGQCVWPTTVAVKTAGGLCTGSLVHPSVVVYAAHCGADAPRVLLGQHADAFEIEAVVDHCETNPEYLGASNAGQDWAFCRLAEPLAVPITPPLYGCETEAIAAGAQVAIAGFGQTAPGMGSGAKHWAQTQIVSTFGNTATIGGDGASTCPGDSGGSAFVQLDDGAWRAISMVSAGVGCESAVHALMHPAVPWIEERSGIDITPCHDVDGTWAPGPECGGFYAGTVSDEAEWADSCAALPVSPPSASCGEAYAEPAQDTGGSTSESGGVDTQTGGGADDDGATTGDDPMVATGDTGGGEAPADSEGGGCEVASRPARDGWALVWLLAGFAGRRRRRTARTSAR